MLILAYTNDNASFKLKLTETKTHGKWCRSSLVTLNNEKVGFCIISHSVTGCYQVIILTVGTSFRGCCHCEEMAKIRVNI